MLRLIFWLVFFFFFQRRVVSRISFFFLGGGSIFFPKKIFFPPGKNGLSRVFGCIPSFLDEASISPRKPHTPKLQNIMVVCSFCAGMKQVKKRWPWYPKVPGEATVRNISKIALKIALLYSQTMSWEGCDVSLRRRRTVRYFYSFRQIFFHTLITVPRGVVGAGVVALHQCQHWWVENV